jgi:hypothetical protein
VRSVRGSLSSAASPSSVSVDFNCAVPGPGS